MIKKSVQYLVDCKEKREKEPIQEKQSKKLSDYPELMAQVHPTLNAETQAGEVSFGSNKKLWWICEKGHVWEAQVKSRTKGFGCPYCGGLLVSQGENDLATLYPELLSEWDQERNGDLLPTQVAKSSLRKVWWKCSKGHSWLSSVSVRSFQGAGCPYCSGRLAIEGETDLATLFPDIAEKWNYKKNGNLLPTQVTRYSNRKVWWKCSKGHEWQDTVNHRTKGKRGCPYCSGRRLISGETDFATQHPECLKYWDYERNKDLSPSTLASYTKKVVWWICEEGHHWEATVERITMGRRCPYCKNRKVLAGYNDLASKRPDIAAEWDYEKNEGLKPDQVTVSSGKKFWWKCKFGHSWKAMCSNRTGPYQTGCPVCSGRKRR